MVFRRKHKDENKDASSGDGQNAEATEAAAQQPDLGNPPQGEGAGSGSGDDLNRPTATPVGPGPDAQGHQGYDPQAQQAYYAQRGYPTQQQAPQGYSPQSQQGYSQQGWSAPASLEAVMSANRL
jgi:hypothetical protein